MKIIKFCFGVLLAVGAVVIFALFLILAFLAGLAGVG